MLTRVKEWLLRQQDIVAWVPAAVVAMMLIWWLAPAFDPRSGIDGFGDLFVFSVQMVKVIVTLFVTWRVKLAYFHDLRSAQEQELHRKMLEGDRQAAWAIIQDRLEFLALFLAIGWFVF